MYVAVSAILKTEFQISASVSISINKKVLIYKKVLKFIVRPRMYTATTVDYRVMCHVDIDIDGEAFAPCTRRQR